MDPIVEIPRNKWMQLRDLYKSVWPEGVVAYCLLDTHIFNPALSDIVNFKVYSPEGDITNGMVATIDWRFVGDYEVLIHPLNDVTKMDKALQDTNIIDWSRGVTVPSANIQTIEILEKLQKLRQFNIRYGSKAFKHLLGDDTQYDNSVCPPDSYVAPLKSEYIPLINQTWTYHNGTTEKFFEILMNNEMTYVLFSSIDHKPMAWISVDLAGALSHLYTLEPYRRRGYGEFITKYAANDLRRKGRTVLGYTVEDNEKPQRMFEKLQFRVVGLDQWIFIH